MRRTRRGFTLIELLVVVVLIGILATIALPKFQKSRDRALVASMKSDLRNLATVQEGYASDNAGAYMPTTAGVTTASPAFGFAPSAGVTVDITNAGAGWSATAVHANVAASTCAIYVNTAAVAPATAEGEPKCN